MRRTKITIIVILTAVFVLIALVLVYKGIQQWQIANREPILKVVSRIPGFFVLPGKNVYYIVYDNGDYERVDEFPISDIETYALYSYDENNSADFPECTKEIIKYVSTLENSNINQLYVIDGRYFFDINDSRALKAKYSSTIFEYLPSEKSVKRIVRFRDYDTFHIQPY